MKKYATLDTSTFPRINVVFTGNEATLENFSLYLSELKEIYQQEKNVAIIFDASKAVIPATIYQKMQANWLKDNNDLMVNYCVGTAYIIPSLILRNVLKAIFSFQKQPVDYKVLKSEVDAENWVNIKLN